MAEYDNSNSGALFKNKKKESDKHPDYRGTAEVGDQRFEVAAWIRTAKKTGEKFMSLKFTPQDEYSQTGGSQGGDDDFL